MKKKGKSKANIIFEIYEHKNGVFLEISHGTKTLTFLFPTLKSANMFIENFKKELGKKGIKRNPTYFN